MRFVIVVPVLLFAAVSPLGAQDHKPSFLFLLTDDQRFDTLGCAGHPIVKTPNLDKIAARGVRFRNSFVTTPICPASRASILTGLYERAHKYTFGTPPIAAALTAKSYPALLRQAGYRTALIGKLGVAVEQGQSAKMFDLLDVIGWPFQRKLKSGETRHIDQIITDRAIDFLKDGPAKQPFCLSISFNSPHAEDGKLDNLYPWPKTVDGMYEDVRIPPPPLADDKYFEAEPEFLRKSLGRIRWAWQFDTPEKYAKNVRAYYRMVSGVDHEVGRLIAELERLGALENTVIVFMSDNGYIMGERGLSCKWIHYEESIRVPLLVADPRLPAERRGKTADELVLNIDIAPTLLTMAGVEVPMAYQGRSLVPLLRGEKKTWRTDFLCEHLFVHPDIPQWEGVRDERYAYARYFTQKPVYEFLYDLKEDPQELKNLAGDDRHTERLQRMRRRLEELRDANGGPYSPERFPLLPKKKA